MTTDAVLSHPFCAPPPPLLRIPSFSSSGTRSSSSTLAGSVCISRVYLRTLQDCERILWTLLQIGTLLNASGSPPVGKHLFTVLQKRLQRTGVRMRSRPLLSLDAHGMHPIRFRCCWFMPNDMIRPCEPRRVKPRTMENGMYSRVTPAMVRDGDKYPP